VAGATVRYETLAARVRDSLATERLMASLSGFFGVLALIIATIGLYGVMSYTVTRRRAEIGIRIVLGAAPREVVRMVLGESAVLLALGVAAGVLMAVVASRWASSLLFGLSAWDPFSFGVAASVLSLVCLLAAWLPARQAARLEPTATLRD
jgi:ABC-type antimicrobial peptide transport system permease subunit